MRAHRLMRKGRLPPDKRRHRASALALLGLGAALPGGCASDDGTSLVVEVFTDLAVPGELDGVDVLVHPSSGSADKDIAIPVAAVGAQGLVARTVLLPGKLRDEAFAVVAQGRQSGQSRVEQAADVRFVPGQTQLLQLFLARSCRGVSCAGAPGKTCADGACTLPRERPSLPGWTPRPTPQAPDASNGSPDGAPAETGPESAGDAGADAAPDAPGEAGIEVPPDAAVDGADAVVDPAADATVDAPFDAAVEVAGDAAFEIPVDAAGDKPACTTRLLGTHADWVRTVAVSPDGVLAASGGYDGKLKLWKLADGSLVRTIDADASTVWAVAFSPDGGSIASAGLASSVKVWKLADGSLYQTLVGFTGDVTALTYSPDGMWLMAGGGDADSSLRYWNTSTWAASGPVFGHTLRVNDLAFSRAGDRLASVGQDATLLLWGFSAGSVSMLDSEPIALDTWAVDFSPDGRTIATGGGGIVFHDAVTLTSKGGILGSTRDVSYSPDGQFVAGTDSTTFTVGVWRVGDALRLDAFTGHTMVPYAVAFSPDGTAVVSGGQDDQVRVDCF